MPQVSIVARRGDESEGATGGLALLGAVLGTALLGPSASATAKSGIPAKVRLELLKDVRRIAIARDYAGGPRDIRAVLTTEERWLRLDRSSIPAGFKNRRIYLVVARGDFEEGMCKAGPECPPRHESVLSVKIPASEPYPASTNALLKRP